VNEPTYFIRPEAQEDLDNIFEYGMLNHHPDIANNYFSGFFDTFRMLTKNPYMGEKYDDDELIRKFGYQKTHTIIYKIETKQIIIARIFHGRQKITEQFNYL